MDDNKVKLLLRICAIYASNRELDLKNQDIIRLYEECLLIAMFLKDVTTLAVIYYSLGMFYKSLGRFGEAIKVLLIYLNVIPETTGYRHEEGDACRNIGNAFLALRNYQEAIKYHERDLAIAVELKDKKLEASALGNLGKVYFSSRRYQEAKEHFEKNLRIAVEIGDESEEGKANLWLGNVYSALAKYNNVIECHKKALEFAEGKGDKDMEGQLYSSLGYAYRLLGDFQNAIRCNKMALQLAIEKGDKTGEDRACSNLGNALNSLGRYKEAQIYFEKQLNITKKLKDKRGEGEAYLNLGIVCYSSQDFHKSIEYSEKSLSIAKEFNYIVVEGKCCENLGHVYYALNKHDKAIECYEKSLGVAIKLCDRSGEGRAYGNIGYVLHSSGQYHKAIKYHEKDLSIAKEIGDRMQEVDASKNLGNAHQAAGEYRKAIKYHKKSREVAIGIGDKGGESNSYGNLGNAYDALGDYHKAIEYYEQHIHIAKQIGDRDGEGKAYGNLGNAKSSLGKYLEAIANHQKSLAIAVERKDRYAEQTSCAGLASDYHSLGNYEEAIKCHEKCIAIARERCDESAEGSVYGNLGNVYLSLEKFDQAIKCFEKALSNAASLGNEHGEGNAYGNLGTAYSLLGQYEQALHYINKNLAVAVKTGDRNIEGRCYGNIGHVYRSVGQCDDAIKYLEQCLNIAREIGDRKSEGFAYVCFGLCYRDLCSRYKKQNDETKQRSCNKKSKDYLNESLLCYERLFDDLKEQDQLKISILDTYISAYRILTMVYIENNEVQKALMVTERGRARALGDILMAKYSMSSSRKAGSKSPLEYCDIEKTVSNQDSSLLIFALESRYVATWLISYQDPLFFNTCKVKGFEITDEWFMKTDKNELLETCINEIVNKVHDCMRVREGVKCEDRSLEQLQESYHQEVGVEEVPSLSEAGENRDSTERDKKDRTPSKLRCIYDEEEFDVNPLEALFDTFVAPVQHKLTQDEVVIIPDGPLFSVPFAGLRDSRTGLFLSEMMRIRIAPSLTTLKVLQESGVDHHCQSGALIVGCPDVGEVMFRGKSTKFPYLQFAKQEAEEIGKSLGIKALTGTDATKKAIKERLEEGVAVIHFATHGSKNGEIVLAPSDSTDKEKIPEEEDYILTMSEAQEIGIRAQLVVLSCCHSGRGKIRSEGVIGMSRAFLAAGARAVVASLWAIDDQATKVFMLKFYSHLKKGESASESLQQAMREMRENQGTYSEPKYWAPFILIGDNVTVSL